MYIPGNTVDILLASLRENALFGTPFAALNVSTCLMDGHAVLENQAITQLGKWTNLGITIMFGAFYRILFTLYLARHKTRGTKSKLGSVIESLSILCIVID